MEQLCGGWSDCPHCGGYSSDAECFSRTGRAFPICLPESGAVFQQSLERNLKGIRIAWSADLGGLPVDSRVTETLEKQLCIFEDMGCIVEEGFPDFSDADEIFKTFRAWFLN